MPRIALTLRAAILATLSLFALDAPARAERTTLSASPLSLFGEAARAYEEPGFDADAPIAFEVEAPANASNDPPGLLIFISPIRTCPLPNDWSEALAARNLIWICPLDAGNDAPVAKRIVGALTAGAALARERVLDPDRAYISGFSGGGRVASIVISQSPQLFDGAIYFSGVNFWGTRDEALISDILKRRYVFVTGRRDFNRRDTRRVAGRYRNAGAKHVRLLDLSYLEHELPAAEDFDRALAYLDEREDAAPEAAPSGASANDAAPRQ